MAFGKAIAYTLDNWEQLKLYLEDSMLTSSNNAAENAIRPFVIGRKNWLFSSTASSSIRRSARSRPVSGIIEVYDNRTPDDKSDDIIVIANNFWDRFSLVPEAVTD